MFSFTVLPLALLSLLSLLPSLSCANSITTINSNIDDAQNTCYDVKSNENYIDFNDFISTSDIDYGYGCNNSIENSVECCACVDPGWLKFDGCADISIDWNDLDITLVLTLNDTILFDTTFGLDAPPALCADIWGVHICLKLEDLKLEDWEFTGCVHVTIDSIDINFGCFDLKKDEDEDNDEK